MQNIVFAEPVSYADFVFGVCQVTGLKEASVRSLAKARRDTNEYVFNSAGFKAVAKRNTPASTIRGRVPGKRVEESEKFTKQGHKMLAKKKTNGKEIVITGFEHEGTYPTRQAMIAFAKSEMKASIKATRTKTTDDSIIITCELRET